MVIAQSQNRASNGFINMGGSNDPLHRGGPAVNSVNNNQLNKSMKQKEGFSNPDPYLGSLNNAAD
jgi:hypothetical protein